MAVLTSDEKNNALAVMGDALLANMEAILAVNKEDVARAESAGETVMVDRLLLNEERVRGMVAELRKVIQLDDEIGKIMDTRTHPDGMILERVRVPLGVVGMIYESRPNVTVDATVLCLKSGNAIMLKGGSEALSSNRALVGIMREALAGTAIPVEAVQFLDTSDRAMIGEFLKLKGYLDVIIPRGGKGLIDFVTQNATVPVIETGASVVHTYVDAAADLNMAVDIVVNAKTRRVSICNALDTLLVHATVAEEFLKKLGVSPGARSISMAGHSVELRFDDAAFGKEFLDYVLAIKVVDSLDEALEHIARYSLKHSEAIVTKDREVAERFLREVDAACVYWNASTQYSDGAQFGLGAEIGISTQKLHVRGPFALEGLTSMKWVIRGNGQVRN